MSSCFVAAKRPTHPAAMLVPVLALVAACGRIGVELLPAAAEPDVGTGVGAGSGFPLDAGEPLADAALADVCAATCTNPHGTARCVAGQCVLTCSAGYADCDGNGRNGCETNVASDPMHCGSCTGVCDLNSQTCSNGVCESSPCLPGRAECDNDPTLVCEADLTSSPQHCGFCGNACVPLHGSGGCRDRSCVITSCESGYADCDQTAGNGCEAALLTSSASCGSCDVVCTNAHGTTSCTAGTCTPRCDPDYGDCDTDPRNGCEASLNTASDCGRCGRSCPANGGVAGCNAGSCTVTCALTGAYAVRLSIPASWPGTVTVSPGSGEFRFWALLQVSQSGSSLTGTLTPCGEIVPDFSASPLINERYGVAFPNTLFDRTPALPSVSASGTLSASAPGSRLALRTAFMMGATMADPLNGAWPSASALMIIDSDADGKSAVSMAYKTGLGYNAPPVNNLGSVRAQTGYIATRIVFALDGVLDSCTQSSGRVNAQDIDVHTVGCRVLGDQRDCTTSEADHLDQNAPDFSTGPGTYALVKVADNATCPVVRGTLP